MLEVSGRNLRIRRTCSVGMKYQETKILRTKRALPKFLSLFATALTRYVYISLSSPDIRNWYKPINRIPLVRFPLYVFHISIRIFVQICIIFRLQPCVYSENYVKLHSFPNKQTKSQTLCNKIPRLTNILSNGDFLVLM